MKRIWKRQGFARS